MENYWVPRADLCAAGRTMRNCVCGFFFIVKSYKQKSPPEGEKMLAKQSSPVENYLTLFFDTEHRLGLQTETVSVLAARTSALECQPYIILESSGACGIWPLGAKYNTLLRWFGSRAWREHHVRLEEISARDTSALRSVSPHTHGPLPQASARLTLLLSPCRLL